MPGSAYKVIEIVGTSSKSWEDAAATAVERASQTLRECAAAAQACRKTRNYAPVGD